MLGVVCEVRRWDGPRCHCIPSFISYQKLIRKIHRHTYRLVISLAYFHCLFQNKESGLKWAELFKDSLRRIFWLSACHLLTWNISLYWIFFSVMHNVWSLERSPMLESINGFEKMTNAFVLENNPKYNFVWYTLIVYYCAENIPVRKLYIQEANKLTGENQWISLDAWKYLKPSHKRNNN
jgi:hypothetical protein